MHRHRQAALRAQPQTETVVTEKSRATSGRPGGPGENPTATPQAGYALIEHTADLGIRCWGANLEGLFRAAATALSEVLLGPATPAAEQTLELELELQAESREELLVAWLNELLFRFEVEGFVPGAICFTHLTASHLQVRLKGEPYDPQRRPLEHQIKAATYHLLEVKRAGGTWQATVFLDL